MKSINFEYNCPECKEKILHVENKLHCNNCLCDYEHKNDCTIFKNQNLFFTLCILNLLIVILNALRFFLVCKLLGLDIPFGYCLLFISLLPFISTLPLLHSDIGARELILGVFSQWLGASFEAGMLAALLDRCFIVFNAVIISLFFQKLWAGIQIKGLSRSKKFFWFL